MDNTPFNGGPQQAPQQPHPEPAPTNPWPQQQPQFQQPTPTPYQPQQQPSYQQPYQQPWPAAAPSPVAPPALAHAGGMFERRIGRIGFLLGLVYAYSVLAVSIALLMFVGRTGLLPEDLDGAGLAIFNIFVLLLNLASWGFMLVVSLSLIVRRLHDLNLSGWAALLYFIPLVGLVLILFLLFKPGHEPNKYGPRITSLNYWGIVGLKTPPVDAQ
jgi:uncharacterized membrane protein YhaH (DUF805 family)